MRSAKWDGFSCMVSLHVHVYGFAWVGGRKGGCAFERKCRWIDELTDGRREQWVVFGGWIIGCIHVFGWMCALLVIYLLVRLIDLLETLSWTNIPLAQFVGSRPLRYLFLFL